MIEESYVSFDTAKLLKEAGFDVPCYMQYSEKGVQWEAFCPENFNADDWGCSCPTQALAARWLREVHHYAVCVWFSQEDGKWFYAHGDIESMVFTEEYSISEIIYETYEEALETGLREAIELIKKQGYGSTYSKSEPKGFEEMGVEEES